MLVKVTHLPRNKSWLRFKNSRLAVCIDITWSRESEIKYTFIGVFIFIKMGSNYQN